MPYHNGLVELHGLEESADILKRGEACENNVVGK